MLATLRGSDRRPARGVAGSVQGEAEDAVVRWGFLGAGGIAGSSLAPAVHAADGARLVAAAARDPSRAAALGPDRTWPAYDALLADDAVDAVYISLANDAHRPWTVAALQAGKHVLCEKPLALSAAEVDTIADAARLADRTVVEASWYRWSPRVRLAQQRLADIGRVRHVAAGFAFPGVPEGDYRLDPGRGGGALYDIGCYAVSACLWAVGGGLPEEVAARARPGPSGIDLQTSALLSWADGAQAEVDVAMDRPPAQWLVITGERGEVELRGEPYTARGESELWVSDGTATERVRVPAADPYRLMVEEVSSVLSGGPGWVLPLAESRATAAVLDAARASASSGGGPVAP
ncbi:MAG: Gfo/Idh/MocA family oxidoreductase [Actinomycetota bacterium]|nr:Gfo/Idh/MocA family oxidoreductase [Actinomycetota bacterium]